MRYITTFAIAILTAISAVAAPPTGIDSYYTNAVTVPAGCTNQVVAGLATNHTWVCFQVDNDIEDE